MRTPTSRLLFVMLLMLVGCGERSSSNPVVAFFEGAERQVESDDQRRVLEGALEDLLTVSGDALKARRYPDYRMSPNAWTSMDVLSHYFVPATATARLDSTSFYQDVADPAARRAIQAQLDAVRRALSQE